MKTQHTPGPWKVDPSTGNIVSQDNRAVCKDVTGTGHINTNGNRIGDAEEAEANEKLITAAPDLLQALQDMREAYQRMFDVMPVAWQTFDHIAEAAITKATD